MFGIAWIDNVGWDDPVDGHNNRDVETWYGADPTLQEEKENKNNDTMAEISLVPLSFVDREQFILDNQKMTSYGLRKTQAVFCFLLLKTLFNLLQTYHF